MAKNNPGDNTPRMRKYDPTSFGDPKVDKTLPGIAGQLTELYVSNSNQAKAVATLISRFNKEEFMLGRILNHPTKTGGNTYRKVMYLLRADYIANIKARKLPHYLETHLCNFITTRIKKRILWSLKDYK